jgi:oligopeptide/dipeptide ABC transporter ATP-binding protein
MAPILRVNKLKKSFYKKRSFFKIDEIKAVNDVSFTVDKGSIYGLVGESGCGKTTTARCILGLERVSGGEIWFKEDEIGSLGYYEFFPLRKNIQMVFQDPTDSLNPHFTVKQTIKEPLDLNTSLGEDEKKDTLINIMNIVGLRGEHLERYPHQLSTGQQQRVGIARAVICNPSLVVLDEPTAALDVSVRGRVLEMLLDLQERFKITYLLISHDLRTIQFICKQTGVMYMGYIIEQGLTKEIFQKPLHPYTQALISAIPSIKNRSSKKRIILEGEVPSPINMPIGCPFLKRCRYSETICSKERPELSSIGSPPREVACHMYT